VSPTALSLVGLVMVEAADDGAATVPAPAPRTAIVAGRAATGSAADGCGGGTALLIASVATTVVLPFRSLISAPARSDSDSPAAATAVTAAAGRCDVVLVALIVAAALRGIGSNSIIRLASCSSSSPSAASSISPAAAASSIGAAAAAGLSSCAPCRPALTAEDATFPTPAERTVRRLSGWM